MRKKLALAFLAVGALTLSGNLFFDLVLPRHTSSFLDYRAMGQFCLMLALALSTAMILSRTLTRDLRRLTAAALELRHGRLGTRVQIDARDEVGDLAASFNEMADNLMDVVKQMEDSAGEIADAALFLSSGSREMDQASGNIARATQDIAGGAERQAASVQRTATIVRALASSIREIAQRANRATRSAQESQNRAMRGADTAGQTADRILEVAEAVERSCSLVASFRDRSTEIDEIVDFILSMAGQTQILALNATIEAAKAGHEGQGFAAVAEEIRALADRTGSFAGQIQARVRAMDRRAADVVLAMEDTARVARSGKTTAVATREILETIHRNFSEVVEEVAQITDLTRAHDEGARGLVGAMDDIAAVARDNAGRSEQTSTAVSEQHLSVQEMAGSVERLAATARSLRERIARFHLGGAPGGECR